MNKCAADAGGCTFTNLGGDASLVAPKPLPDGKDADLSPFAHIAAFVRGATLEHTGIVWQMVTQEYLARLSSGKTAWLSTSGLGVYWLHFRIDARPKYYQYKPFAAEV